MKLRNGARRGLYVAAALCLAVAGLVSEMSNHTSAAQVQTRSITMSDSNQGTTGVSYNVKFNWATTGNVGGIVIDFCDNTPIIGDTTCSVPTGFTVSGSPTFTINSTSLGAGGTWTAASLNSGQVFELSNSTAQSMTAGNTADFVITSVTNPTTDNHSFYARIVTYATAAGMTSGYTVSGTTRAANPGGVDNGGIALSTGKVINVTARVMETLSFCVYKTACGDDPSLTLGHGTNNILDASVVDTGDANWSLSTNAQNGAIVRVKGDTLKAGANDINAAGASSVAFAAGTEMFGLRVSTSGTNITAAAPYNGAANNYGLDVTTALGSGGNVTTTYGDVLANLSGPVNGSISTITFGATAANTTAAGIYTAAEQLIVSGTF
jgi:hypothetical protein